MAWMKMAHVDVVSLDWWGQGSREDRLAKPVLDGAAAQGLKVNFVIDSYSGETPASIGSDIAYIYRKYGSHPAFFRAVRPTKYGPSTSLRGLFMLYNPPAPRSLSEYARLMDGIRGTANDAIILVRIDDSTLFSDAATRQGLDVLHVGELARVEERERAAIQAHLDVQAARRRREVGDELVRHVPELLRVQAGHGPDRVAAETPLVEGGGLGEQAHVGGHQEHRERQRQEDDQQGPHYRP